MFPRVKLTASGLMITSCVQIDMRGLRVLPDRFLLTGEHRAVVTNEMHIFDGLCGRWMRRTAFSLGSHFSRTSYPY